MMNVAKFTAWRGKMVNIALMLTTYGLCVPALLTLVFVALRVDPARAFRALLSGAIGDPESGYWYSISETLVEMAPLLLTGLSVVVAWRAGLFSIGAEGQLLMGALAAVALWNFLPNLPPVLLMVLMLIVGCVAGAFWGLLAGWMRVRRGVPEVISTIMLNYVALSIVGWLVKGVLHGKTQAGPYSDPIPKALSLPRLVPVAWSEVQTRLHLGVVFALLMVPIIATLLGRTRIGFGWKLIGQNEEAARVAGFKIDRLRLQAMLVSGALCGLAGTIELLGVSGRLGRDFSSGWGYKAIPVALLGGLNPTGAMFAALFFGALEAGCANAQREANVGVPSVVSYIVQAVTVLVIVGVSAWQARRQTAEVGT